MEFSGRTVDEAIFHGLMEMGVTIDEVEIETLQTESRGIFGIGSKMAVVRLTEREQPVVPDFEAEREKRQAEASTEERPRREARSDRPRRDDRRSGGRDRRNGGRRDDRRGSGSRDGRRDRQAEIAAALEADNAAYDYSAELAKTEPAGIFLTELLEKMGLPSEVVAANTDNGLRLRIETDSDGLLIGRRGETLDALQYIVSLYANKGSDDYRRITVDTEGYRARREETLRRLARKTANEVLETGTPIAMEPMNPYERRILHSALQDMQGISTHSEGEEPNRRVIITPED